VRAGAAPAETEPAARSIGALRDPVVLRLCLLNFVFSFAVTQLETVFAYFMQGRFGYDAAHVAVILVGMAIVMGGIQGGGMKALSARFEERTLVSLGTLLLGIAFLAMPEMPTVALLILPLVLSAVGRAISQPALMGLVSVAGGASARGSVMGTFQASASLARVAGPTVAGVLYDTNAALPFWLAGALALLVCAGRAWLPARAAAEGDALLDAEGAR